VKWVPVNFHVEESVEGYSCFGSLKDFYMSRRSVELKWAVGFSDSIASEEPWSARFKCQQMESCVVMLLLQVLSLKSHLVLKLPHQRMWNNLDHVTQLESFVLCHIKTIRGGVSGLITQRTDQHKTRSSFTLKCKTGFFSFSRTQIHVLTCHWTDVWCTSLLFALSHLCVTLHQAAFALSAHRVARLNRLYVQVFGG